MPIPRCSYKYCPIWISIENNSLCTCLYYFSHIATFHISFTLFHTLELSLSLFLSFLKIYKQSVSLESSYHDVKNFIYNNKSL